VTALSGTRLPRPGGWLGGDRTARTSHRTGGTSSPQAPHAAPPNPARTVTPIPIPQTPHRPSPGQSPIPQCHRALRASAFLAAVAATGAAGPTAAVPLAGDFSDAIKVADGSIGVPKCVGTEKCADVDGEAAMCFRVFDFGEDGQTITTCPPPLINTYCVPESAVDLQKSILTEKCKGDASAGSGIFPANRCADLDSPCPLDGTRCVDIVDGATGVTVPACQCDDGVGYVCAACEIHDECDSAMCTTRVKPPFPALQGRQLQIGDRDGPRCLEKCEPESRRSLLRTLQLDDDLTGFCKPGTTCVGGTCECSEGFVPVTRDGVVIEGDCAPVCGELGVACSFGERCLDGACVAGRMMPFGGDTRLVACSADLCGVGADGVALGECFERDPRAHYQPEKFDERYGCREEDVIAEQADECAVGRTCDSFRAYREQSYKCKCVDGYVFGVSGKCLSIADAKAEAEALVDSGCRKVHAAKMVFRLTKAELEAATDEKAVSILTELATMLADEVAIDLEVKHCTSAEAQADIAAECEADQGSTCPAGTLASLEISCVERVRGWALKVIATDSAGRRGERLRKAWKAAAMDVDNDAATNEADAAVELEADARRRHLQVQTNVEVAVEVNVASEAEQSVSTTALLDAAASPDSSSSFVGASDVIVGVRLSASPLSRSTAALVVGAGLALLAAVAV